ncbi:MAG: spore cortex biosynthesis protein YabQ [Clostridiales bacterium GWB2_37_7]|nr:MAG: spore cortex biosynthesis protein YabQ [Clostridiales bacterium GWB2_37_7]
METVEFQSFVFMFTVYGGIVIGILYDIYRVLKGSGRRGRFITSIWDILFLAAALLVVLWALFSSNYGDVRAYVFIGFIVGFFLYDKILSKIAIALFLFIKRNVVFFFKTTNNILMLPFKFLFNLLWHPLSRLWQFIIHKRIRISKLKKLPGVIMRDSRKYYKLIIRKNRK